MAAQGTIATLRRFSGTVHVLVVGTLINSIGMMISPYLTLVLTQKLRMPPLVVSKTVLAYGVGALLAVLVGGLLTDKLGRRTTIMVSMFGAGSTAMMIPLVGGRSLALLLLVCILGAFTELYRPASSALLADALPSRDRALGFSALRVALNCGAFIGLSLGGVLLDWNWRWLFWFDGATSLACGVIAAVFITDVPRPAEPALLNRPAGSPAGGPSGSILPFALALIANLLLVLVYVTHTTVLPLSIARQGGYSGQMIGALLAINVFLVAFFELFIVNNLSRFRRLRVAALGCLLMGVGLGASGLSSHWSWYAVTIVLWSLGEMLSLSPLTSFILDCAPAHQRGKYVGLHSLTWRLGFIAGPVIFLNLFYLLPVWAFWLIMPAIAAPTALLLAFLDRRFERDPVVM